MKQLVTPKQVAKAIGVSESSLKRWCDKGVIPTVRTAGGHRRIPIEAVIHYLRESGQPIAHPELLGLPATTGQGPMVMDRARGQLQDALMAGEEAPVRRIVFDLYLAGTAACDICDKVLAEAFHGIGAEWQCGRLAVYRERRACEIALRALHELRSALPRSQPTAPYALGGTLTHDVYVLPTTMVEVVLREAGWRAESYGNGLPVATLCEAIHDTRPALVWLSVSHIDSRTAFLAEYAQLEHAAAAHQAALVVGGQALDECLRREMRYSAFCDTLRHLLSFTATLALSGHLPSPAIC